MSDLTRTCCETKLSVAHEAGCAMVEPEPVTGHQLFIGHDPTLGISGTDLLLTVWSDGSLDVATRPGENQTRLRWSPPVRLGVAP